MVRPAQQTKKQARRLCLETRGQVAHSYSFVGRVLRAKYGGHGPPYENSVALIFSDRSNDFDGMQHQP